jgi:hypothetical protein
MVERQFWIVGDNGDDGKDLLTMRTARVHYVQGRVPRLS